MVEVRKVPRTDKERVAREEKLIKYLDKNPVATDQELADKFKVSINTLFH